MSGAGASREDCVCGERISTSLRGKSYNDLEAGYGEVWLPGRAGREVPERKPRLELAMDLPLREAEH